ncbi:MAG: hypothetical protein AAFX99_22670 [Myxococcota bacterium]
MAESIDDLTITWEDDDGVITTQELDKAVLSKGAWTTIVYLYQDLDRKTGEMGKRKVRIQRYQKRDGEYKARSKFNISSAKQARKIMEILQGWFDDEDED